MIKKFPMKLTVLAVSALKFGLLQVGLMQPIQAFDLCAAVSSKGNVTESTHCQLVNLIEKFEKMSILDAKEALKNAALDQETLKDAFALAQQKNNAVAMAVLANQFKVLKNGHDVLSMFVGQVEGKNAPKFDKAEFKNSLAEMLSEMIAESHKSQFNGWSAESIKLTQNAVTKEAQRFVEVNMNHFLVAFGQKGMEKKSAFKNLQDGARGTGFIRLYAQMPNND